MLFELTGTTRNGEECVYSFAVGGVEETPLAVSAVPSVRYSLVSCVGRLIPGVSPPAEIRFEDGEIELMNVERTYLMKSLAERNKTKQYR